MPTAAWMWEKAWGRCTFAATRSLHCCISTLSCQQYLASSTLPYLASSTLPYLAIPCHTLLAALWSPFLLASSPPCSTSPYADKGLTWQQAVQWVPEVEVQAGQRLLLTARHDTYSISYAHNLPAEPAPDPVEGGGRKEDDSDAGVGPMRTAVPLADPVWQMAYERLQGLNGELVKACVQNPLEYRAVAQAALQFATRPHDLDIDAQQAADFCVKLMG